ncbi:MAG: hypothetical protein QXM31_02220 [Candidatus Woesearchaeota archaeon]
MSLKYLAGAGIAILALASYFSGSISAGFMLGISLIMTGLIPGYTLLTFLVKDLEELEKVILGFFIGLCSTAMILYYLNFISIASIKPVFSYAIGIICVAILVMKKLKQHTKVQ